MHDYCTLYDYNYRADMNGVTPGWPYCGRSAILAPLVSFGRALGSVRDADMEQVGERKTLDCAPKPCIYISYSSLFHVETRTDPPHGVRP